MKKVIITGGGTGGHLYPALSIIESISGFCNVSYCGHPNKIEAKVASKSDIPFIALSTFPKETPINLATLEGKIFFQRVRNL